MQKKNSSKSDIFESIFYPIKELQASMSAPFKVLPNNNYFLQNKESETETVKQKQQLKKIHLNKDYELNELLKNKGWLEQSIKKISSTSSKGDQSKTKSESNIGNAFSKKYGEILNNDDARNLIKNWSSEIDRAKSHLNPKSLKGDILHIGADSKFEPQNIHEHANSITLADISEKLLSNATQKVHPSKSILTKAENLKGILDSSIDLYVALRVFNSINFRYGDAIQEAKRVLRIGGSILLSLSNGYEAIDDTILPGQIVGIPSKLSLSQPFQQALKILTLLYEEGFSELFLVPGSAELFIGGTILSVKKSVLIEPILHTESINNIPLCFYSEKMPTAWLGNYSSHSINIDGILWPTVEHYFQSEKFIDFEHKNSILNIDNPALAKEYAWQHHNKVRSDWDEIRVAAMKKGLIAKFSTYPYLKNALLKTGKRELIERSPTDIFWGSTISGKGQNKVGYLLNEIRNKLL
jgi:ribA/ribD-fused uncharacterized protein